MSRLGLKSRAILNIQRIGVFTKERESKEQYRPLKICLEARNQNSSTQQFDKIKGFIYQGY